MFGQYLNKSVSNNFGNILPVILVITVSPLLPVMLVIPVILFIPVILMNPVISVIPVILVILVIPIIGDQGADKWGDGKSKRAEKYIRNEKK